MTRPCCESQPPRRLLRHSPAYYGASLAGFRDSAPDAVLGELVRHSEFPVTADQRDAWLWEIEALQRALGSLEGWIAHESIVPRLGSRIDAVVVFGGVLFLLECKVGARAVDEAMREQAWDYALDLKNFHETSHSVAIVPLVLATEAPDRRPAPVPSPAADRVYPPMAARLEELPSLFEEIRERESSPSLDGYGWSGGRYQPTPTILEAARNLYARHTVEEILRSDAGARNLQVTFRRVQGLIDRARERGEKRILFVTGVLGAGKTLVGLNIATHRHEETATHAVYLSGNGPLIQVLSEALIRDEHQRRAAERPRPTKKEIGQKVKAFLQNVHHFRDEGLRQEGPPADRVILFDEAQRAWDRAKTEDFLKRRKNRPDVQGSEPEILLEYVDRWEDWTAVVCLVGGGQEIHTGEAGIGAWLEAVRVRFPHWKVSLSPHLTGGESDAGEALAALGREGIVEEEPDLHLATSMRSFRAETVAELVRCVLDTEAEQAADLFRGLAARYPIVLARDLAVAREWLRERSRGSERCGLLTSSNAYRLKPHAIDVRVTVDPVHYFLNAPADTRSSAYLEDAATEFQVQGLELDWTCVCWDADLRWTEAGWSYHRFRGSRWETLRKPAARRYLLNAYRVLLTRARQGMVLFLPPGDPRDPTRAPAFYDATAAYLGELGVRRIG